MLTVTGEIQNNNASLRHGIDDYIARSYNLEEVVARVHAVLRRTTAPNIKSALITCGQVQLDENAIIATKENHIVFSTITFILTLS